MTALSDSMSSGFKDGFQFRKFVHIFDQIIEILNKFQVNYDKKLNFSKLIKYLNIPHSEEEGVLTIVLKFQELFEEAFCEYRIKKKRENNTTYLIVENKFQTGNRIQISLSTAHVKLFNDIIYTFKFINRGKGFDLKNTKAEFLKNLEHLRSEHPYLFNSNGNGIIYTSKLGLKLGEQIISYYKSNQKIDTYIIQNYRFKIMRENG